MKFVLVATGKHSQALETIADVMTKFMLAMPRLGDYKRLFPSSTLLQYSLAMMFLVYVDLCILTAQYFRRNAVGK